MKKKLLTIAFLLCCTQIFAQKTFEVEKILYQQKHDSFWSYVTVKDIIATVSYSRDTLFVDFPEKVYYVAESNTGIEMYYDDCVDVTHIYVCADSSAGVCNIECVWRDNKLSKVVVKKTDTKITYVIKKT